MPTYVIGDIHGCLRALDTLLQATSPGSDDELVFLGDYVDRGPACKQTLDRVMELRQDGRVTTLKGNHEIMMLNSLHNAAYADWWKTCGGHETLQSFGLENDDRWFANIPDRYIEFMHGTQPYYKVGSHIMVHAGLTPGVPLVTQDEQALYWHKYVRPQAYSKSHVVVSGHTARKDGQIAYFGHTIGIDTYAYGGQWLSCLDIDSGAYWQANQAGQLKHGQLAE